MPRPVDEAPAADKRLRRALQTLGPLTRYHWRRVADLATCARPMGTVDATAADLGMRPQDYRRWVRRLLGVTRKEYEALPGWEPVLELALRRGVLGLQESRDSSRQGAGGSIPSVRS